MKVLDLFSGTGSIRKICIDRGYEVVSLDMNNDKHIDIQCDIMKWDYKKYKQGYFDIIFSSPPCQTFSHCRKCWLGRKTKYFGENIITPQMLYDDMINNGLPILRKTEEIIAYFQPIYYFIENPKTGRMKEFMEHHEYFDIDYCKYSDWGYRKRTRFWTNLQNFDNKLCKKDCGYMVGNLHKNNLGNSKRNKKSGGSCGDLKTRYRIPPNLISSILDTIENK